jgi:hypothetical protein
VAASAYQTLLCLFNTVCCRYNSISDLAAKHALLTVCKRLYYKTKAAVSPFIFVEIYTFKDFF